MQLIQKLQDDKKRMRKVFEDMSGSYEQKSIQDRVCLTVPEKEDRVEKFIGGLSDNIQGVARAYTACNNEKKGYAGALPYYKNRALVVNQRVGTCFECGIQGHFKKDCPELKNQNHRNKARNKKINLKGRHMCWEEDKLTLILTSSQVHFFSTITMLLCYLIRVPIGVLCRLPLAYAAFYTTRDLELGVVVFTLKMWRHYLYRTKCVVFNEHKSLQHILDRKELNMRQCRWLELLSDYDCEIRYHLRKANVVADALSRKERIKPLRDRALVMTIGLNIPKRILNAQAKVCLRFIVVRLKTRWVEYGSKSCKPFEELLILSVKDRFGPNKDDVLGMCMIPLQYVERMLDHKAINTRRFNLVKHVMVVEGEKKKEVKFASKIHMRYINPINRHWHDRNIFFNPFDMV
nr:putative reverse transcriptase domain-containing protein [Tanacetum cinerariifolium]